jgi:hypothetical protein
LKFVSIGLIRNIYFFTAGVSAAAGTAGAAVFTASEAMAAGAAAFRPSAG